jgi:hypothetical protein
MPGRRITESDGDTDSEAKTADGYPHAAAEAADRHPDPSP